MAINGLGSVSGAFATQAYVQGQIGLVPVTPTSIANSGGSASASGGEITFTGVSSISLNGVFTSTYKNYRMSINFTAASAADVLIFTRLRASGSDNASSYTSNAIEQYSTSVAGSANYGGDGTKWTLGKISSSFPGQAMVVVDLMSAGNTDFTNFVGRSSWVTSGGTLVQLVSSGRHDVNNAEDGISIISSTGTISGTIRVYGYKNS